MPYKSGHTASSVAIGLCIFAVVGSVWAVYTNFWSPKATSMASSSTIVEPKPRSQENLLAYRDAIIVANNGPWTVLRVIEEPKFSTRDSFRPAVCSLLVAPEKSKHKSRKIIDFIGFDDNIKLTRCRMMATGDLVEFELSQEDTRGEHQGYFLTPKLVVP